MFFVDGKATDATSADDKPYTYDSNNDSPGWASPAIGQTPPGYAAVPQYQYSQGYTYATGDRVAQRAMPSRGSDTGKAKGPLSFSRLFRSPKPASRTASPYLEILAESFHGTQIERSSNSSDILPNGSNLSASAVQERSPAPMRPPPVPPKQWDTFDRTSLKASERIHPLPSENLHKESKEILVKATKDSPAVSVYSKGINSRKTTPARGGMYMKVLYDYDADEKTSLSLRQGDIIQVITQLESGWWEGVLNDVCGWFPSNYCVVVQTPPEEYRTPKNDDSFHATFDESSEDEVLLKDTAGSEDGFWIPQATPDGRLFYFNTLTGVSTMELPLESPVAASPNETIPELKPMEGEDAAFRIPRSTPDRTLFSFNSKTGETRREPPKNSLIPPSSHHKISEPTVLPFMITSKDLQKRPERQPATYGWELEHTVLETDNGEPFSVCNFLGHGSLGTVEEVRRSNTELPTLVRKRVMLSARRLQAQATIKIIQEEAKNLKSLVHQHIITLLGSYEETKPRNRHSYYLLMSPVGENDLRNFLEMVGDENETRSQTAALSIWKTWIYGWFACLASALAFMHGNGIRHQDIKPSNIIHKGQDIYFTDFSSSCAFDIGHTTSTDNPSRASPMYAAPEIIENYTGNLQRHGRATDIFALGCVFCDMLSVLTGGSVSMFQGAIRDPEAINFGRGALYYSQRLSQISEWFTSSAIFSDHICAMLQHSRDLRPTAMAVVQWFVIDNIFNDTCTCWQHSLWCADSEGQMSRRKVEAVQVRNKQNVFVPLKYATDDDIAHIERHGIHSDPWTTRRL